MEGLFRSARQACGSRNHHAAPRYGIIELAVEYRDRPPGLSPCGVEVTAAAAPRYWRCPAMTRNELAAARSSAGSVFSPDIYDEVIRE